MKVEVEDAVNLLKKGEAVAIPTETVYGLAARIDSMTAIEKIFQLKKRPFFDPLIVHVYNIKQAQNLTENWGNVAQVLSEAFWPGPLTLVLPKKSFVSDLITAGLPSVALRMPQHSKALQILKEVGVPLAAPSANLFGKTSPSQFEHVEEAFDGRVPAVDGGSCEVGIESTVVSLVESLESSFIGNTSLVNHKIGNSSWIQWEETQGLQFSKPQLRKTQISILRRGMILQSQMERVLNQKNCIFEFSNLLEKKAAPGQMKHHYMPKIPFFLVLDSDLTLESMAQYFYNHIQELPAEVESVAIQKPSRVFSSLREIVLSENPNLATREFYALLRVATEGGADGLFCRIHSGYKEEVWGGLLERMIKASSLLLFKNEVVNSEEFLRGLFG